MQLTPHRKTVAVYYTESYATHTSTLWEEWGISNAKYVDTYNSYRASNGYTDHTAMFASSFSARGTCCIFIFQVQNDYSTEPTAAVKTEQRKAAVVLLANNRTRILISCSVLALIRHKQRTLQP
jgi:hypothetical protein